MIELIDVSSCSEAMGDLVRDVFSAHFHIPKINEKFPLLVTEKHIFKTLMQKWRLKIETQIGCVSIQFSAA